MMLLTCVVVRSERIASLGRKLGTISTNFAETFVSRPDQHHDKPS